MHIKRYLGEYFCSRVLTFVCLVHFGEVEHNIKTDEIDVNYVSKLCLKLIL